MRNPCRTTPHVKFHIDLGSTSLAVQDVWPDGDAPENPSAEDVATVMREYGGLHGVITGWNLVTELTITDGRGGHAVVT